MKKIITTAMMLFLFAALTACGGNEPEYNKPSAVSPETPALSLPAEGLQIEEPQIKELQIQMDLATDELLSTFTNLHHASVGESGLDLVIWANQPLPHLAVMTIEPEWLENVDEWGFSPRDNIGYVEMLLPGEGYVINNYMGLGTLPHMAVGFFDDAIQDTRVFFFQENNAYPEHGNRWIISEVEADRLVWGFAGGGVDPSPESDYIIIINGTGFTDWDGSMGSIYTVQGEDLPTHVTMSVLGRLGIDAIQGGSQISLQYNGGNIGVGLSVENYLAVGERSVYRVPVGINDTFMADDGYFTTHVPISLLRYLGFDVYFEGGRVHINGQFDTTLVRPHPLAIALQNFIENAQGETKALTAHVYNTLGVVAIEFIDGFAWATLFVDTGSGVISREIGSIEGFPYSIGFTTNGLGNLVITTGDGGNSSYTMVGIGTNPETGADEIINLYTMYQELVDGEIHRYHRDGGAFSGETYGRSPVSEEDFNLVRNAEIGDRISSWREFSDSTEFILGWAARNWFVPVWG